MNWYVIHSKPRQEQRALENLSRQGFECYLPILSVEKIQRGALRLASEPMFPRYLFLASNRPNQGLNWTAIRSTKGVCNLVSFGQTPATASASLISSLRNLEVSAAKTPQRLFSPGQRVQLIDGPFAGVEGEYQKIIEMHDGEARAIVLLEILSRKTPLNVLPQSLVPVVSN